jgi:nucleoside-diphosphate-sugar epimerase
VNVGYGTTITIKDFIRAVIVYSGKKIGVEYDLSKPQVKTKLCLDISKARNEFGWSPGVSLDDGIKLTIDWWKKNIGVSLK